MPLSQAIIGDIISPRERANTRGLMGASFGSRRSSGRLPADTSPRTSAGAGSSSSTSRSDPDALVVALYMHVPNGRRKHAIDVWGSVTLSTGITCALLATVWGGGQYPVELVQIIGPYSRGRRPARRRCVG